MCRSLRSTILRTFLFAVLSQETWPSSLPRLRTGIVYSGQLCMVCRTQQPFILRRGFSRKQFDRGDRRMCKGCIATDCKMDFFTCDEIKGCDRRLHRSPFADDFIESSLAHICKECEQGISELLCSLCYTYSPVISFSQRQRHRGGERRCSDCWKCSLCSLYKRRHCFSKCLQLCPSASLRIERRFCNDCVANRTTVVNFARPARRNG